MVFQRRNKQIHGRHTGPSGKRRSFCAGCLASTPPKSLWTIEAVMIDAADNRMQINRTTNAPTFCFCWTSLIIDITASWLLICFQITFHQGADKTVGVNHSISAPSYSSNPERASAPYSYWKAIRLAASLILGLLPDLISMGRTFPSVSITR